MSTSMKKKKFGGSRVIPRGRSDRQKDRQGQTNMTKLRFAFYNFAKPSEEDMC